MSQRRIVTEPQWRPIAQITSMQLPAAPRPWLLDDGSLTTRLIESRQGLFAVQRLSQSWEIPLFSEQRLLQQAPRQQALIREVVLSLSGRAVVFARSVFPISSLNGSLAHLRRLQNKSLGAILFKQAGMHRSPFEVAHIAGDSEYLPLHLRQRHPAWARRCRFEIQGKSLMVSEVFLEKFIPWTAPLPVHRTQRGVVSAAIVPATQ